MRSLLADVRAFHEAMEIPVESSPTLATHDRRRLRGDLIAEEAEETVCALDSGDLVEIADGLADLIYVAVGTALELGIPLDRVWDEVHRSNMAKRGGPVRADGKQLKPEGWQPPDIARAIGMKG